MKEQIEQYLRVRNDQMGYVFPAISSSALHQLDLSSSNPNLTPEVVSDTAQFNQLISTMIPAGKVGIGGYLEHRSLYQRSAMYSAEEVRSIHMGADVWLPAETEVFAPWEGVIHSFQDNQGFGDYGPTIILEHTIEGASFYTLYGHLSRASLETSKIGQRIEKNQMIGTLGDFPENGDWPPHLHFQVMTDMLTYSGDFPGVIAPSQQDFFESICIDPMLLLTFK